MTMLLMYSVILKYQYFNFQFVLQIIYLCFIVLMAYIRLMLEKRMMNLSILIFIKKTFKNIVFKYFYKKSKRMKNFKFCIKA